MRLGEKTYLGDGLYAVYDGWGITITSENGGPKPLAEVYLEPDVLSALNKYDEHQRKLHEEAQGKSE